MLCAYTRPRYQTSVYRTIGPLVLVFGAKVVVMSLACSAIPNTGDVAFEPFFHRKAENNDRKWPEYDNRRIRCYILIWWEEFQYLAGRQHVPGL